MNHKKHFTYSGANKILEEIKPFLKKMMDLKLALDETGYDIYRHRYFGGIGTNGTGRHPKALDELIECLEFISSKGIVVKGIENGLIDFPHINRESEEVYLCYLYGEDKINFWHRPDTGFKGRRPIEEL